jgi:subtilisin family serine protease
MMQALAIAGLVAAASAAPITQMVPLSTEGDIIPGEYIVVFKKGIDADVAAGLRQSVKAKHTYKIGNFSGFSGSFSDEVLASLRLRTDIIESIEANQVARTNARQANPPSWGLGASSSRTATDADREYIYPDQAGAGIDVYVIDTGIRVTHNDFGDRARWGIRYGNGGQEDGNGHGTHCAGTVGGTSYGIAKQANLVAVGVLGPAGSGSFDDVIAGVNWAADDCRGKCVGSMSLGGGASAAVDEAVNSFVSNTRFMAVAAGNSNVDARNSSPARAADVYTVMASDSNARKASYSNYGSVCQVWAPGSSITSAWSTSDSATNTISGTSMACPHVAGQAALAYGTNRYPDQSNRFAMENYLNSRAVDGVIVGVPAGTPNAFLQVDESL